MSAGLPRWLLAPAVIGFAFVVLPLAALAAGVEWGRFVELIGTEASRDALWLSVRTATASTVLCLVFGVPMAAVLARAHWRGLPVLRALVLLPLVLPPVVGGIALLYTFGRRGLLGEHLEAAGISIAFSTTAVVLAQTFVALPFLVLTLEGALRTAGGRYEQIAATLGARPSTVWWRITLPLLRPALISGAVLAFARALGEFGATLTFAGSLQGRTRTLPLEIYLQREADPDAAVALSVVLIIVAVLIVLLAYRRTSPIPGTQLRSSGRPDTLTNRSGRVAAPGSAAGSKGAAGQREAAGTGSAMAPDTGAPGRGAGRQDPDSGGEVTR